MQGYPGSSQPTFSWTLLNTSGFVVAHSRANDMAASAEWPVGTNLLLRRMPGAIGVRRKCFMSHAPYFFHVRLARLGPVAQGVDEQSHGMRRLPAGGGVEMQARPYPAPGFRGGNEMSSRHKRAPPAFRPK